MTSDSLIPAIIAFLGGTGFSSLLKYFTKNKQTNITTEAMLRQELTDRLDNMYNEMEELKKEVSFWRDKYLELYKAHADLRAHLGILHYIEVDEESGEYKD